jgi:hypothetical protein
MLDGEQMAECWVSTGVRCADRTVNSTEADPSPRGNACGINVSFSHDHVHYPEV